MSKLNAIEILEIKLLGIVSFDSEVLRNKYKDAVEKAKEMEKEQIMDAHIEGMDYLPVYPNYNGDAENYYNETYKKEEK